MIHKANKAAFLSKEEADQRAAKLNMTRYKRSRIKVKVIQMNPFWVIVGFATQS